MVVGSMWFDFVVLDVIGCVDEIVCMLGGVLFIDIMWCYVDEMFVVGCV